MKYFQILLLLGINYSTIVLSQSIELPQKFMNKDEIKNIPIFIYNVTNLESIQLKIEYDESIILAEDIIENPVGILDGGYTFTTNLTEPGIIHIAIGSNSANVFSGSGMIAQITLHSIGNLGEFSTLTILDAQINSLTVLGIAIDGSIEIILDELTITGQDVSAVASSDIIYFGMRAGGHDGWDYGEDQYDIFNNSNIEYIDLEFIHNEWQGDFDDASPPNICCDQVDFFTDYRKQHSFRELISWGVSGSAGGGLSSDIDINLSWDSDILNSNSDNFKMFLYVGSEDGVDMQEQNSITISQSDLSLNGNGEPNIWVKMGGCADIGETTTSYLDYDGDGLGSGITAQYCSGYEPAGWVTNSNDVDDYCYSNEHDCENICDGILEFDCLGECGGTSILDECNICNGNNLFCTDCNNDIGGPNGIPFDGDEAYFDGCGNCVGGNTGNDDCPYDCLGEPNGTSTIDNCGICDDNSSNDCVQDCAGEWGGDLVLDDCLICGGPGPIFSCLCIDIPEGECDCAGHILDECGICDGDNITCTDCAGTPNGSGSIDKCGTCDDDDDNDCVSDCAGNWGGPDNDPSTNDDIINDDCGECGGIGIPDGDCDCEGNQFDECGICGGESFMDINGLFADGTCDCDGNFEDECGTCDDDSSNDCVKDCAGEWGGDLVIDECGDCVGIDVFDYNENMDIFGSCCSLDEKDLCGECEGIDIPVGECDCAGNVLDCAGECGGSAEIDNCSVCNNYETRPEYPYGNCDCVGNPNGIASIDNCGICDDNPSNDCTLDCLTIQDGPNIIDDCGTCDDNPDNNCIQDCAGLWGGYAVKDDCEICAGGTTGVESCVEDCIGTLGGTFWVSDCGCVEADNSGDECDDCAENPNGTAELDLCGNCIKEETDTNFGCSMDCDDVYGGNHPPTFSCENGDIACNENACFDLAIDDFLLPQRFDINRIYPNPFNPQATIDFEVSEPTMVQLNIYNLKGQKVNVIKDAFTLPGHYSVIWNGTNYPSGIYFVILHSSNSIVKQKMMLIK